jgi:hypothetical protein
MKMRLRSLAAVIAAAVGLPVLVALGQASPASAATCKSSTNDIFNMEVCSNPYGGTVITYLWEYNEQGHFKVWNHDNTSQWQNSIERYPWLYNEQTQKLSFWTYTCAQFQAYQGNRRWAPVGPIWCIHL